MKKTPLILISLSAVPTPLHEVVYKEVEKVLLRLGCKWRGCDTGSTAPYTASTKLLYIHNISSTVVSLMYSSTAEYDEKVYDHKHRIKNVEAFDAVTQWDSWCKAVREAVAQAQIPDPVTIQLGGATAVVYHDKVVLSTQVIQVIITQEQLNCINETVKKISSSK